MLKRLSERIPPGSRSPTPTIATAPPSASSDKGKAWSVEVTGVLQGVTEAQFERAHVHGTRLQQLPGPARGYWAPVLRPP